MKKKLLSIIIFGTALAMGTVHVANTVAEKTPDVQSFDEKVLGKTSDERAKIASQEVAKGNLQGIHTKNGITIEIVGEVKEIEVNGKSGVEVYAKAWKGTTQLGFGSDGSVEIERFRVFNPPVFVPDDNGKTTRQFEDSTKRAESIKNNVPVPKITKRFREDPNSALVDVITDAAKISGTTTGSIIVGKVGRTTDTFYPVAGANSPVDGTVSREGQDESWASVIAGAGTAYSNVIAQQSTFTLSTATSNQYWGQIKFIFCFDTSTIGADTISSATLSVFGAAKGNGLGNQDLHIVAATPASTATLAASDYSQFGSTSFGNVAYADYSVTGYNDIALSAAGIANISTSGVSKFGAESNWNLGDTPTWASGTFSNLELYFADTGNITVEPKLVVVHSGTASPTSSSSPSNLIIFN